MKQDKIQQIIELENKFQKLTENCLPNVVDTGLFIDAIFNVTESLKKELRDSDSECASVNDSLRVISNLYDTLIAFNNIYTSRLS